MRREVDNGIGMEGPAAGSPGHDDSDEVVTHRLGHCWAIITRNTGKWNNTTTSGYRVSVRQ